MSELAAAPKKILTAASVAPMDGPIIPEGAVVLQGDRILAVGETRTLLAAHGDVVAIDCGDVVLLPGLVNAHCHLDLTNVPRPPEPRSFVDWLEHVIGASAGQSDFTSWFSGVLRGRDQCTRFGVTSVGDIAGRYTTLIRQASAALDDVRVTSFGEVTAMAQRRGALEERLRITGEAVAEGSLLRAGISPHAPYSIEAHGYRRCLEVARRDAMPLTTHLAETADEAQFLASHTGPLRELWTFLNAWDDEVPKFVGGPIRFARSLGLLDYERTLLAHVNYCDDDELAILARGKASVVYCPRTHRYFEHPPHRWREMLAAGVNVAVGTDSCASSPDLNLVDDLRLMHEIAPEVEPRVLWEMMTVRGARAIDAPRVGSLAPGQYADVVAFPINSEDPLREILESSVEPDRVWCGGRLVKDAPG